MIQAALRGEFDYYQKARQIGAERFVPTPDPVIKVMLDVALKLVDVAGALVTTRRKSAIMEASVATLRKPIIVEASKPRPKRR